MNSGKGDRRLNREVIIMELMKQTFIDQINGIVLIMTEDGTVYKALEDCNEEERELVLQDYYLPSFDFNHWANNKTSKKKRVARGRNFVSASAAIEVNKYYNEGRIPVKLPLKTYASFIHEHANRRGFMFHTEREEIAESISNDIFSRLSDFADRRYEELPKGFDGKSFHIRFGLVEDDWSTYSFQVNVLDIYERRSKKFGTIYVPELEVEVFVSPGKSAKVKVFSNRLLRVYVLSALKTYTGFEPVTKED